MGLEFQLCLLPRPLLRVGDALSLFRLQPLQRLLFLALALLRLPCLPVLQLASGLNRLLSLALHLLRFKLTRPLLRGDTLLLHAAQFLKRKQDRVWLLVRHHQFP
jgi:hypothetical protein